MVIAIWRLLDSTNKFTFHAISILKSQLARSRMATPFRRCLKAFKAAWCRTHSHQRLGCAFIYLKSAFGSPKSKKMNCSNSFWDQKRCICSCTIMKLLRILLNHLFARASSISHSKMWKFTINIESLWQGIWLSIAILHTTVLIH